MQLTQPRPALWQVAVLAAYAIALALLVPRHEPWFDEAQAWLLARDASVFELYAFWLRYEGNPGLWHALLVPLAKAGAPYFSMQVLGAALGVLGAGLFVLRAPFPGWVRALFPFTYFPFYQYAAVARPYTLAGPLFFSLAALWPRREERPFALAALLAGLALVSVHGWLIAGALAALHALALWRRRSELSRAALRAHVLALGGLGAVGIAVVAVLAPPEKHGAIVPGFESRPALIASVAWRLLDACFTEISLASAAVLGVSLAWLRARGALALFAVPAAPVVAFVATKEYSPWHEGMLFLLWVFALWVAWAQPKRAPVLLERALLGALALVLAVQLSWSLRSARHDFAHAYSSGRDVARYLAAEVGEGERIFASGYGTFSIQPYFASNRFANHRAGVGAAFFDWRSFEPFGSDLAAIARAQPDVVIVGVKDPEDERFLRTPERFFPGYTPRVFLAALYWKNRPLEWEACVVYRRERPLRRRAQP